MGFQVGIAGCGVAGLTAAVMLARAGHRVVIHEQAQRLEPVGAGVLLHPSGNLVLQAMGLLDAVVAGGERIERLTAYTHRGGRLIDLPYGELGEGATAYGLRRGALFAALYAAALEAGAQVRTGERIGRVHGRKEGAYLACGEVEFGPYDFVLAADGARSALREQSGLGARVHAYPHGALWAVGPCGAVRGKLRQICRGTRELCGVLPTGNGQASLFWSVRNDAMEALRGRGFGPWREEVAALCPEAREIFEAVKTFDDVRFASYMHVHMQRPFNERCLFVGDAAHAMSPHLGQGINLALIDGYAFAGALAACGDFPSACAAYTRGRAEHLRAYRIITYWLSPFFQSRGVVRGWGRDLFLPLMPKMPFVRRQMVVTMAGLRRTLTGGRWQLPATAPEEAAHAHTH